MPPGGHYRQNNLSNPYNQYPQQASSQFQNHNAAFNTQHFGAQSSFPMAQPNRHMNLFGSALPNGAPGNAFGGGPPPGAGGTGLASQEAQMRFAQGAAMQQQEGGNALSRGNQMAGRIRDVYSNNMEQEFAVIRSLTDKYPYISMDTEFPGIVARPMGDFRSKSDYHYQTLRANVDMLKLIQLGITLWSPEAELPPPNTELPMARNSYGNNLMMCPCTWMFNFKFSESEDMSSQDSIDMLKKAGVNFEKCEQIGIEPKAFGARLIDSGLVCQPGINWLSFHSGYDFGYLTKIMYPVAMPESEDEYVTTIKMYFGRIWDVKYLFRSAQASLRAGKLNARGTEIIQGMGPKSGLQDLANELGCTREGKPHTAGSDSLLTGTVFWALREQVFDNNIPEEHVNKIWGLNQASVSSGSGHAVTMQTPNSNGASLFNTGLTPSTYRPKGPNTPQSNQTPPASTPGTHGQGFPGGMEGGAFSFLPGDRQLPPPPGAYPPFASNWSSPMRDMTPTFSVGVGSPGQYGDNSQWRSPQLRPNFHYNGPANGVPQQQRPHSQPNPAYWDQRKARNYPWH